MELTLGKLAHFYKPFKLEYLSKQCKVVGTIPVEGWEDTYYMAKVRNRRLLMNENHSLLGQSCGNCGKYFTMNEFPRDKYAVGGRASSCKTCRREKDKKYRKKHPTYYRRYYRKNKEHISQTRKAWLMAHPEKLSISQARRHMLMAKCVPPDSEYIKEVSRDQRCVVSGATVGVALDHIMPVSRGNWGSNRGNLMYLTKSLNVSKGMNNVFDWIEGMEQFRLDYLLPKGIEMPLEEFKARMYSTLTDKAAELGLTLEQYRHKYNSDYGNNQSHR